MSTTLTVVCVRGIESSLRSLLSPGVPLPGPEDLVTCAFSSTSAAVSCAVAVIDRVPGAAIGIDVGDVDEPRAVETFSAASSSAVLNAQAIARSAVPGQIVVSEVTALLTRDAPAVVLRSVENRPGMYLLSPRRPPVPHRLAMMLPRQLAHEPPHPFVERPSAWAELQESWKAAREGPCRTVFVGAEAGAGKTRLLAELARHVAQSGTVVLYGGSSEDVELPFQPFVEALRPLLDTLDPVLFDAVLPTQARDDLALILPKGATRAVPGRDTNPLGRQIPSSPETDRHWAFEAVIDLLRAVASHAPVLLLLDDLHWAARPTLRLMEHVLRSGRLERVCIVAAYRDTPAEQSGAFAEALGDFCRRPGVRRFSLAAFDERAIRLFVSAAIGTDCLPVEFEPVVAHLFEQTGGNAFLLAESWRHLIETARIRKVSDRWIVGSLKSHDTPVSVRAVTNHRLTRLPPACRPLLELGSCVGMTFDVGLIAAAAGQSPGVALELLSQAVAGGLLVATAPSSFSFVHALIRQAIEDGLTAAERPLRHQAIAKALQLQRPNDEALLAHHFAAAVPLEPSSKAVFHARAAAARSMQTVSFDEAIAVLLGALHVTNDDIERADLLIDLGLAFAQSGAAVDAAKASLEAAALARSHHRTDRLLKAAKVMAEATWRGALHGGPAVTLLREALSTGPDPETTCSLLGGLSVALAFSGRDEDSVVAGNAAIELATKLGDVRLLSEAIHDRLYVAITPEGVQAQLELALRGLQLAADRHDLDAELRLGCKAMIRLLVLPDPPTLKRLRTRTRELAERLRQPYYLLFQAGHDVTMALSEGRLAAAEEAVDRYQRWTEVHGQAESGLGIQMFSIRREQGRLAELRPMLEVALRLRAGTKAWAPGLAALYAEIGMIDEARGLLDELVEDGLKSVPRDTLMPGVLSYLTDAACATRHRATASLVLPLLAPYSGLLVYVPGLANYGAADRYIGRLHDVLGQHSRARSHYEAGLALDERTGWTTWVAHSRYALGCHLADSSQGADLLRSKELLEQAEETAAAAGMAALAERCRVALEDARGQKLPARRSGLTSKELQVLRLVAVGRSNREIGDALFSSQHTVANHVRAILGKIGCVNRTQAAAWAHQNHVVTDGETGQGDGSTG